MPQGRPSLITAPDWKATIDCVGLWGPVTCGVRKANSAEHDVIPQFNGIRYVAPPVICAFSGPAILTMDRSGAEFTMTAKASLIYSESFMTIGVSSVP